MPAFAPVDNPESGSEVEDAVSEAVDVASAVPEDSVVLKDVDVSGNSQPFIWIANATDVSVTVEVVVYQLDLVSRVAYVTTELISSSEVHCPVFPESNMSTKS